MHLFRKASGVFKTTFRSLQYRNFRYFWFGQCISLIGTWMQRTAQVWLVYSITKSPLLVGILGVCQFTPTLLFTLFAGVLVDHFSKKHILIFTQAMFMLQAVAMTALTYTGRIQYWHILVLSAVFGLTQTIDMPARQSFFIDMVGKKDVMNAISLNSTIVNVAKIVGPAVSGIIMVKYGPVFCFFVNACSYIAVIFGICMIRTPAVSTHRAAQRMGPEIMEGVRYVRRNEVLMMNVILTAVVCTFAMNNDVIIPVFSKTVLGQGAGGYTGLMSAAGVGAFIGAVLMAFISKNGLNKSILIIDGIATAAIQISTLFTRSYAVSLILIGIVGFINLTFINTANSIFQVYSTDQYRGRVMSVYSFLVMGSTPIGNYFAGSVMESLGGDSGFVIGGIVTLAIVIPYLIVKRKVAIEWLRAGRESYELSKAS